MSFREIRNFCEIMRSLGYSRIISMENFRTPNFELVADILDWLLLRVDPECDIPNDIEEERQRINFITNVAKFFLSKTRIKLNLRKLYEANGYAVRELLKIATMLYKAQSSSSKTDEESLMDIAMSSKLQNLKTAHGLATQITDTGAKLFDLLSKEKELRDAREKALGFLDNISRNLDSNAEQEYIRKCIRDIIQSQTGNLAQMEKMLEELENDEKTLEAKIKKRTGELERAEKRMKSLQTVRPGYMDEYERLEQEIEKLYEVYVVRFRNLAYLEHDLDEYSQKEEEKSKQISESLNQERNEIMETQKRRLIGDGEFEEGDIEQNPPKGKAGNNNAGSNRERPMEARQNNRRQPKQEESDESDLIDEDEEEGSLEVDEEGSEEELEEEESDSIDNDF
ncbi:CLUAP1_1 [Blepharisma stoltei]|uniref:Clusterin-associated protein 1 n=1 Tax=Blepharisma stoltei TaxID=1481888 RepID=A0AAU9J7T1_9CILI|nr:unnamed protein product [Blepharisma stoltei]